MRISVTMTAALLLLSTAAAFASSSTWHNAEGVRMRIATRGAPAADGTLQGVLQIDLKPGWKTYWRDPGSSGVPPSLDIAGSTNVAAADLAFPPPARFDDESGPWSGYKHSVAFPVTFRLEQPDAPATITAQIFIGVCETICVPVQAELSLDPASDPDNADDSAAIDGALAQLPQTATVDFGASILAAEAETLTVEARFPGDPGSADLFVAGTDGYTLGTPKRSEEAAGRTIFTIPILDRPAERPQGKGLPFTLTTHAGAVEGLLPYP